MIYYFSPFDLGKNLGKGYNAHMELLPNDDDWGCLTDGDVMFLTTDYGKQIQDIVNLYPDTGLFTCITNRVGQLEQCYNKQISENYDLRYHETLAKDIQRRDYLTVRDLNIVISGHLMLVRKDTWRKVGGFYEQGILAVDNKFSFRVMKAGLKVRCMMGVYVFHKYRIGNIKDKNHLK